MKLPKKVFVYVVKDGDYEFLSAEETAEACAELPSGRLIVAVSRHLCAVIDGVIHDTFDPSRDGTRCVYGYFQAAQ